MAFVVQAGKGSIRMTAEEAGVPYSARVTEICTEITIPENFHHVHVGNPNRYFKIGQITLYDNDFVCYHAFIEFEKQSHGLYVINREAIMPFYSYEDYSSTAGAEDKSVTENTIYNTGAVTSTGIYTIQEIAAILVAFATGDVVDGIQNIVNNALNNEEPPNRQVIKTKPYYVGWLKCATEFELEVFNDDASIGLYLNPLR